MKAGNGEVQQAGYCSERPRLHPPGCFWKVIDNMPLNPPAQRASALGCGTTASRLPWTKGCPGGTAPQHVWAVYT